MDSEPEKFSWKKYFTGIFDPLNFAKYSAHVIQIIIIAVVLFFTIKGISILKNWLFPQAPKPIIIGEMTGGKVDSSANKKTKIGLNIF